MNEWTWILLSFLFATYLLDVLAGWLNLKSLRPELPEDFHDVYDRGEYAQLLRYTAVNTRFGWAESTFQFLVLAVFWLAGGFDWLDTVVRSWQFGSTLSGLCYLGLLWLGSTLVMRPFDLYHTFVIEQRFGFNKTTAGTWIADQLKGLLIGVLLGGAVFALVLWLLRTGEPLAWLWVWIASAVLMIVMVFLAPAVIMPLFNKFTALEPGELKDAILAYGEKENFPIAGLYVMDGSRRSTRANAFFTGFGRTKKIVLFDTLIKKHTVPELVAVLAHEIGHFKLKHIPQHLAIAVLNVGVFLFLASRFIETPALFEAFGVREMSVYAGLALFMIFYSPLARVLAVIAGVLTRKHEYQADRFAVETTGEPQAMIDALKKLSKSNLSNLRPHWLTVVLYHSHPPVLQRVEAIQRLRLRP
ncbi:MAG TPA: M48 family metallopeptidase [Chthoniobacterales bacterium]